MRQYTLCLCLLLLGCRDGPGALAGEAAVSSTPAHQPTATTTQPAPQPLATTAAPRSPTPFPTWTPPITPEAALSQTAVSSRQQATHAELTQAIPPQRDEVGLALAYRGLEAALAPRPGVAAPLNVGVRQQLQIANVDTNTFSTINVDLLAVSDYAYFWFDVGPGSFTPDTDLLAQVSTAFDDAYEMVVHYFSDGYEAGPDGDPRIHIVHASPLALCDVTLETASACGLAGYFSSRHTYPQSAVPDSNEREMFVMNVRQFGTDYYLTVLVHEFRHMVEYNYDRSEWDWAVEGSAMLAEDLWGTPQVAEQRANLFLRNPNQPLKQWTAGDARPHYGQGYAFNRYLFDRLGEDLYRQFATSPLPGLRALDEVLVQANLPLTSQQLWLDWLVALAIHNEPQTPPIYRFGEGVGLDTAVTTRITAPPVSLTDTLHPYGAAYYELDGAEVLTVTFTGSTLVPLLDTLPRSGEYFWYAQRANYSQMRLTRPVDLRQVAQATLQYAAYVDVEAGYDFAYVVVSADNGRSWQGLQAANMQSRAAGDDPAGVAFADHFYTGRQRTWFEEEVDLTPYAGQEILLRFEYITDQLLTYGGLALDNIAIPEIGFVDDASRPDMGWTAEGFTRATAYLPQSWHLQLITFPNGRPVVTPIALDEQPTATSTGSAQAVFTIPPGSSRSPILIVAATAPRTLEVGHYRLVVE
jgi:immune inhibitor A